MANFTIPIELQLSARSQALIDFMRTLEPLAAPAAAMPDSPKEEFQKIGEAWPGHGGIYAGIARGLDGEPDGHLVLLDDLPASKMDWADAIKWADGLGNGARLPTRFESALLYANLQDKIEQGDWYWTGTQYSSGLAWVQDFLNGLQTIITKSSEARARAVRRFAI